MFRRQLGLLVGLVVLCSPALGHAENYVAFAVGPNLATFDTTDSGEMDLKDGLAFGGKFGHYFDDRGFNWFGLEVDIYRSSTHIKAADPPAFKAQIPSFGTDSRRDFLVHSLAFNALVRVTGYQYKIEPYTGLGIGLNMGNVSDGNFRPEASFAPSFNILAGVKYYLTPKSPPSSNTNITSPSSPSIEPTSPATTAPIFSCSVLPTISDGKPATSGSGIPLLRRVLLRATHSRRSFKSNT